MLNSRTRQHHVFHFVALFAASSCLFACSKKTTTPAESGPYTHTAPSNLACNMPPATPSGTWFTEISNDVGLGVPAAPTAQGTAVWTVDLDNDGFGDIVTSIGPDVRETLGIDGGVGEYPDGAVAPRFHYVLMNRPDPSDATKRIFVESYDDSNLGAVIDGAPGVGRGFLLAFFGDLDNDGDNDVVTCPGGIAAGVLDPCTSLLNDGTGHFSLAPQSDLMHAFEDIEGGALFDYDGDGVLDFWPGPRGGKPKLFHGNGDGTFTDVTAAMGLPTVDGNPATNQSFRQTLGVTTCDLDGDGDQDVLLSDYGREHNQVWINGGGTHFTEQGVALGLANDGISDYQHDDESYLCYCQSCTQMSNCPANYCASNVPAPLTGICPDRGWYVGESDQDWRLGGVNFTFVCGDVDNDLDMDVYLTTIHHWDVGRDADPTELIVNDAASGAAPHFTRPGNTATGLTSRARQTQYEQDDQGDLGAAMIDLDLDGMKDIYVAQSDYPGSHGWIWRQTSAAHFSDVTMASGIAQNQIHGLTFSDLDNDGDLDLVGGTSTARGVEPNSAIRAYQNQIGQNSNWTQIGLVGLGQGHTNRNGIGARVKITAGGTTQVQEMQSAFGVTGIQNGYVLTFGLGSACMIDSIEVRWADAAHTVQTFTNVHANVRLRIAEGDSNVLYATPAAH